MTTHLERTTAEQAARHAAAEIRRYAGRLAACDVRSKTTHDLVTVADEAAQRRILRHLREVFPEDGILAEEGNEEIPSNSGRRWVIDPLDGTTNFTHGVPPYAVSIALEDGEGPLVGVVYDITADEMFTAVRNGGVTVNGKRASVSATENLDAALIATGFPFRDYHFEDGFLETFVRLTHSTRGVRRHGAAAIDLAWTSCGRFDGFYEAGLAPWDVAAGVLLVREGGGRVTGLTEDAEPIYSGGLVAAAPGIFEDVWTACRPLAKAFQPRRAR